MPLIEPKATHHCLVLAAAEPHIPHLTPTMKRKFSFNLAPVVSAHASMMQSGPCLPAQKKVTGKPDDKPTPEPTPPQTTAKTHHRHASKDSKESEKSRSSRDGVCDNSPYIQRRPLDAQTERELRVACRLILQNFKPSDHGMEDTDPKLDFGAMDRRRDRERKQQPSTDVKVRMPTGAPTELTKSSSIGRKPSKARTRDKADREIRARTGADAPVVRATSTRKPRDFGWLDERDDKRDEKLRNFGRSPSIDITRNALARNDSDEDISLPVTVPSTLATSKVASTAPTSASLPSGMNSNRRSRQLDNPVAIADAAAAEWMSKEREKFKPHDAGRPPTAVRSLSRSASIKDNIREYVFPGSRSRALSRAASSDSLHTAATDDSEGLQRSGSRAGRRLWGGVARKLSSRSNSRPGTSRGHGEEPNEPRKSEAKEVNLNRELPPLPSLDTWKTMEQPKEDKIASPKSPVAAGHIASLMRAQEQQAEHRSPAARSHHRKSGSDTLAMQFNQAFPIRQSSRHQIEIPISPHGRKSGPSSPIAIPHATSTLPTPNHQHGLSKSTPGHTRQRSGDADSIPTSTTKSSDAATFSRKMSLDIVQNASPSSDAKGNKKDEQKSRLKKVFTGWMSKKEKKDGWMNKMEKEGVKEGVLVHEGTSSPVVRY